MYMNVIKSLCSLPATDGNFTSVLKTATSNQIRLAIETMEHNGGKNKGRIKACERELENRRLTKKGKDGKYVSKEHLSILCNTFSAQDRLKAILNKLGEYEDAERQGVAFTFTMQGSEQNGQQWIPVSERLPEKYGTYLVAWKPCDMSEGDIIKKCGKPHYYEILEYDPDGEALWIETIEQAEGEYVILAWMPMPEPYKESEE